MESFESHRIPFGILNGVPVGIECVPSGLACNCFCPSCGGALQARKGDKNAHHFSHDPTANKIECKNALETSIHLMAKHIIYEEGVISFPELLISVSDADALGCKQTESEVIFSKQKMKISEVLLEQKVSEVRPDITAYVDGEPVLIEIAVTHFVDKYKKEKIREMNVQAIEINLSKVDYRISKSELREIIVESTKEKKWISYPSAIEKKRVLKEKLNDKIKKINSTIQTNRDLKTPAVNYINKPRKYNPPIKAASNDKKVEYDSKWFKCKKCHNPPWRLLKSEIPENCKFVKCPCCQSQVSTARV